MTATATSEPRRPELRLPAGVEPMSEEEFERHRAAADEAALRDRQAAKERNWESVCGRRFADARLSELDQPAEVESALSLWLDEAQQGDAGNLVLLGDVGVGKTYCAVALGRELYQLGRSVLVVSVVEFFAGLMPDGGEQLGRYTAPDYLVLDDLGVSKPSAWKAEQLFALLDRRWRDCRPVMATSNFEPVRLVEVLGQRAYDRLRDGATSLHFAGASRRRSRRTA